MLPPFTNLTYGVDGCNEPMFRIGYNTPLYTYTDERSAKGRTVAERINGKHFVETMSVEFLEFLTDCYRVVYY